MNQQKSPSEDLLYRPHMSPWWWLHRKNYFLFMVRELSAVFVGLFALICLVGVYRLGQGEDAYQLYLSALQTPSAQVLFVVILLFSIYHTLTWIHLTPMIMVVRIGSKTVPPVLVLIASYLAWIVISLILFYLLVPRPMNTMTFADGAWEGKSRSEEEVMQGPRRRQATQRSPATPISPKGGGGTASISLSLLLHDVTDIASSSLRELDAVALATNVTVFMGRDTNGGLTWR